MKYEKEGRWKTALLCLYIADRVVSDPPVFPKVEYEVEAVGVATGSVSTGASLILPETCVLVKATSPCSRRGCTVSTLYVLQLAGNALLYDPLVVAYAYQLRSIVALSQLLD